MQETPELENNASISHEKTPEKSSPPKETKTNGFKNNKTPLKEAKNFESEFRTPEKKKRCVSVNPSNENKTPEKSTDKVGLIVDQATTNEGEDGMISITEQARLLMAVSKTPSKSINKTPVKQNTPNGKRSIENSPVTPGKFRRVELITLASPKAKRIKQI